MENERSTRRNASGSSLSCGAPLELGWRLCAWWFGRKFFRFSKQKMAEDCARGSL
jgi:hypothetical protein